MSNRWSIFCVEVLTEVATRVVSVGSAVDEASSGVLTDSSTTVSDVVETPATT